MDPYGPQRCPEALSLTCLLGQSVLRPSLLALGPSPAMLVFFFLLLGLL